MRIVSLGVVLLLATGVIAQTTTTKDTTTRPAHQDALHLFSDSIENLSLRTTRSVVQIFTTGYTLNSENGRSNTASVLSPERGSGSGVILTSDGYIVTNAHVVTGARKIRVVLNPAERESSRESGKGMRGPLDGKLVGMDRLTDVAVIKVEATGLTPLTLADSADLKQGQIVLALGSPLGLENSVSMGVVSGVARQIDPDNPMIYIQTDAPINPGNSGGPLADIDGNVVGLNTFIYSQSGGSEGLGFAIPSNIVRNVYEQLRSDGHVHRGQIGVYAKTITPALAEGLHLQRDEGVILEDVFPGGPADSAGLKVGDIVLSVDGRSVDNIREFALSLFRFRIGQKAQVDVVRAGQKITASVPVIERADDPQRFADMVTEQQNLVPQLNILGLTLTEQLRDLLPDLRIATGVVVAARTGTTSYFGDQLQQGDVIHAVNGAGVTDVANLREALSRITTGTPTVLQIERQGSLSYVVLESE